MRKMTGMLHPIEVFINGTSNGVLDRNTPSLTLNLSPGNHTIDLKGGGLKKTKKFSLAPGNSESYIVYFSSLGVLGGGIKFKACPISCS